jgi:FixJ family two-component response regulator
MIQGPTRVPSAEPVPPGPGDVVYVIDDDESVRRSLDRLLRSAGLGAETFPSAQAFLERELPDRTACVVLDVRMPGASGLDLQAALNRAARIVPIIFLTGHGNVPMSVQAMKGGAIDFLQKPIDEQQLLAAVDRALERCRVARAEQAERAVIQRRYDTLTPRERQVLGLVVTGLLNKQIAANLGAAEKTIKIHRGRVMRKMEAASVADLVRMSQRLAIVLALTTLLPWS